MNAHYASIVPFVVAMLSSLANSRPSFPAYLESGRIGEDRGYSSDGFTQPSRDLHAPGQLRVLPIG